MSNSRPATVNVESFAIFGTIMTAMVVVALAGNIVCFRMTRRLLWNKPSLALVLNLNMSDIIVATISWVGFMSQHIAMYSGLDIHVIVHKVVWSILIALGNVTLLTLVGLAGDCFIALRWPLHYKSIATYRCVNIYIGVIWICSALTAGGDFMAAINRSKSYDESYADIIHDSMVFTATDRTLPDILTASITMLTSNLLSFLCLLMMVAMYTYILLKIRRIRIDSTLSKQGGLKSEITAVRTTLMIFTSFLLLWLPTLVINIISVVEPNYLSTLSFVEVSIIGHTADSLLMVHSMVDALIYGVRVKKTIRRQKRSRQSQAGFSRANTLRRRSSDSDKAHPEYQDEITNETTISEQQQQRRLSISSSLRVGASNVLTTISESVQTHITNTPPSDDSGINSPHKLSPQNLTKISHTSYVINPSDCYTQYTAADTDDEDDELSCTKSFENPSEMFTNTEEVRTNRLAEIDVNSDQIPKSRNTYSCIVESSSNKPGDIIASQHHDNQIVKGQSTDNGKLLAVPKLTQPLRSSLKKNKRENATHDTEESRVRFCFPSEAKENNPLDRVTADIEIDPKKDKLYAGVETLEMETSTLETVQISTCKEDKQPSPHDDSECHHVNIHIGGQCHTLSNLSEGKDDSLSTTFPLGLDNGAFSSNDSLSSDNDLSLSNEPAPNNGTANSDLTGLTTDSSSPQSDSTIESCCLHDSLCSIESNLRTTVNPVVTVGNGMVTGPSRCSKSSQDALIECTKL